MSGMNKIPNSDIIGYTGAVGHERAIHQTHFSVLKEFGGNERVKIKTPAGYTFVSLAVAEEEGLDIVRIKKTDGCLFAERRVVKELKYEIQE